MSPSLRVAMSHLLLPWATSVTILLLAADAVASGDLGDGDGKIDLGDVVTAGSCEFSFFLSFGYHLFLFFSFSVSFLTIRVIFLSKSHSVNAWRLLTLGI
jgi:hypothetical protein